MKKSWLPTYLVLGFVWGCSFIFIELGLVFLSPFGVTFVRCALGAITLLIFAKIRKVGLPKGKSIWKKLWVVAMLLNVASGVLFAFAQQYITSALAGIINATTPLTTLIFMLLIFREEKINREQVYGLLIGALGVITVVAVIVGWLYINEEIAWHEPVGALVVIIGALLSQGRLNRWAKIK